MIIGLLKNAGLSRLVSLLVLGYTTRPHLHCYPLSRRCSPLRLRGPVKLLTGKATPHGPQVSRFSQLRLGYVRFGRHLEAVLKPPRTIQPVASARIRTGFQTRESRSATLATGLVSGNPAALSGTHCIVAGRHARPGCHVSSCHSAGSEVRIRYSSPHSGQSSISLQGTVPCQLHIWHQTSTIVIGARTTPSPLQVSH